MHDVVRADQIHADGAGPLRRVGVAEVTDGIDLAGVVDDDVEPVPVAEHAPHGGGDGGMIADVAGLDAAGRTQPPDRIEHRLADAGSRTASTVAMPRFASASAVAARCRALRR